LAPRRRVRGETDALVVEWAAEASGDEASDDKERKTDEGSELHPSEEEVQPTEVASDSIHDWVSEADTGIEHPVEIDPALKSEEEDSGSSTSESNSAKTSAHPENDNESVGSSDFSVLGAALCKVKVPHLGYIGFYANPKGGYFVAVCTHKDHQGPNHCKTSRVSYHGKKKGQGRPLGYLMCWLLQMAPDYHGARPRHRDDHVKPDTVFKPTLAARKAARAKLMLLDGAEDLASQEFGGPDVSDPEPEEFN